MKKTLLLAALSSLLLSGCVISVDDDNDWDSYRSHSSWSELEQDNRNHISNLSTGQSIESVRRKMGVPDFDELLVRDGSEHRILYYRTQRNKGDGATTKDECTPIIFVDGELTGFGETALNAI